MNVKEEFLFRIKLIEKNLKVLFRFLEETKNEIQDKANALGAIELICSPNYQSALKFIDKTQDLIKQYETYANIQQLLPRLGIKDFEGCLQYLQKYIE